ncbi:hypothetical protein G6F56_001334 [Rhizopus delemar]|nr:hypothetical protein G6F56_001334 [Rhizopus delemar]
MNSPTKNDDASFLTVTPIWSIVVIVVLGVMVIIFAVVFIRRFRKRYHVHVNNVEKKPSIESLATLVTRQQQKNQQAHTLKPTIKTLEADPEKLRNSFITTTASATQPQQSPVQEEEEEEEEAIEPLQEIKISLPLPPPSTSFFSDKMELDGHSSDLYDMYSSSKKDKNRQSTHNNGFISIDLDSFSNAAANIHRKASTMKKSLYQSMRKPNGGVKPTLAQQIFAQEPKQEAGENSHQVAFKLNSEEDLPNLEKVNDESTVKPKSSLSSPVKTTRDNSSDNEEPALAAKRIIRSASRKARARSMILNPDQLPQLTPKQESQKYATVRSSRVQMGGEQVTISSGSVRRLVRQSILVPEESFPPMSSEEIALPATLTRGKQQSNANAMDISKWWEGDKKEEAKKTPETATQALSSSGSSYSVAPQYRASLNNSVFSIHGTLSKKSGSALFQDEELPKSVSRHNSTKKGTMGKNALKTLTTNATNGMNKSLRGLFEQSSSLTNINKVVPSDSQKMELDFEEENQSLASISRQNSRKTTYLSQRNLEHTSKYSISSEGKKKESIESSQKVEADAVIMRQSLSFTAQGGSQDTLFEDKEVNSIRKALQSTWNESSIMKENESDLDYTFDFDSTGAGSMQPLGANKPSSSRQSLLTKSLITQQAKRTTELMRSSVPLQEEAMVSSAPEPVASFSSSTIRTVVPDREHDSKNRLSGTMNGSNKILATSFGDEPSIFLDRFTSHNGDDNSHLHSRQSSGGNSTSTAVRISGGYPSSTWNGRGQKNVASRLSVTQIVKEEPKETKGAPSEDKRGFFSTMRKDKKTRGGIPWMASEMTPAQIERNKYLNGST